MGRWSKHKMEDIPLLARGRRNEGFQYCMSDTDIADSDDEVNKRDQWLDTVFVTGKKKKGNLLLSNDSGILIFHFLQIYALLQSMSLRWPWPETYLHYARYIFLINLDVWEFIKLNTNGTFRYVQDYYIPSEDMGFSYFYYLIAWGALLFLLFIVFIIAYLVITFRKSHRTLCHIAYLNRVYIVLLQLLAIPIGVAMGRLFHCRLADDASGKYLVDVENNLECLTGIHWAYIAPVLAFSFLLYIIFPAWLIFKVKAELLNLTRERHEAYLQLKEAEFVHGLDVTWIVGNFHIFASFEKRAVHFRAAMHIFNFCFLIIYASAFSHLFAQVCITTIYAFFLFFVFIFLRPFRIRAFNIFLIINILCITCYGLVGCIKTSDHIEDAPSVWMLPRYQTGLLLIIGGLWVICLLIFIIYVICRQNVCNKDTYLWPAINFDKLSFQTRKYVETIIHSRLLIERVVQMQPMFSPVHEISRYIYIVNAQCREAEKLRDPLQDTMWDVLEDLIQTHSLLAPRSLFAESTKESIRTTAAEFMKLMPMFVRRLAQREYDFILMNPVKRRLLLKMYIMGLFLNGRRTTMRQERLRQPAIQHIWHNTHEEGEMSDPGYFEDMYPPREPLVSTRTYLYPPEMVDYTNLAIEQDIGNQDIDDEMDDTLVIEETEQWLQQQGVLPGMVSDDDILSMRDLPKTPELPAELRSQRSRGNSTELGSTRSLQGQGFMMTPTPGGSRTSLKDDVEFGSVESLNEGGSKPSK